MDPIEILVDEHKLILRGLDLLTTAAEKIVRNQNPPKEFFEKAVDFTYRFTNIYCYFHFNEHSNSYINSNKHSYFYSDSASDLPMLSRVAQPRVVNPDWRLRLIAKRSGWPVLDWRKGA